MQMNEKCKTLHPNSFAVLTETGKIILNYIFHFGFLDSNVWNDMQIGREKNPFDR